MADDFPGSGWWDTPRTRYDPGTASSSSSSSSSGLNSLRGFGWLCDASGGRSSMESATVSGGGPAAFLNTPKMHVQGHGADPGLHMMNLGLPPSQTMDWNSQNLLQDDKSEAGFSSLLQDNLNVNAPAGPSSHHQIQPSFQIESSSIYGAPSPSTLFQGIPGSENQPSILSYQYSPPSYSQDPGEPLPSWSKIPPFLRISPPNHKQQAAASSHNQLHFSNNAPFWNATAASPAVSDAPSTSCYFPSPPGSQFSTSSYEQKSKKLPEGPSNAPRAAATGKKSGGSETAGKRARGETMGTALPPFKVRKEKTGDRITALQQLISPFGKTDTASVLTEAIDHIKLLHEQVNILSAPYMKSGGVMQKNQKMEMPRNDPEGPRHDLRSRGLCLVPVSSTFPVTQETAVDFWNPTFGGTYR